MTEKAESSLIRDITFAIGRPGDISAGKWSEGHRAFGKVYGDVLGQPAGRRSPAEVAHFTYQGDAHGFRQSYADSRVLAETVGLAPERLEGTRIASARNWDKEFIGYAVVAAVAPARGSRFVSRPLGPERRQQARSAILLREVVVLPEWRGKSIGGLLVYLAARQYSGDRAVVAPGLLENPTGTDFLERGLGLERGGVVTAPLFGEGAAHAEVGHFHGELGAMRAAVETHYAQKNHGIPLEAITAEIRKPPVKSLAL